MAELPAILPMTPYYRPVVWGGRRLESVYGKDLPANEAIGESFEVSAIPEMESVVTAGSLAGANLRDLTTRFGKDLLGEPVHARYGGEFPLLIKLLDANDDLSIQVHPDDAYARKEGLGTFGKMEAWYVLKSDDGRVASGLKEGVGRKGLVEAIEAGTVEEAVEFHPVSAGDVVYLKPGSVHALCRGVMVYEVQQSSSITFRLYDYNRPDADGNLRELHVDRSLDVIDFDAPAVVPAPVGGSVAVESEHFVLEQVTSARTLSYPDSFATVTVVEGSARLSSEDGSVDLSLADTALIPAARPVELLPAPGTTLLIATVP